MYSVKLLRREKILKNSTCADKYYYCTLDYNQFKLFVSNLHFQIEGSMKN